MAKERNAMRSNIQNGNMIISGKIVNANALFGWKVNAFVHRFRYTYHLNRIELSLEIRERKLYDLICVRGSWACLCEPW